MLRLKQDTLVCAISLRSLRLNAPLKLLVDCKLAGIATLVVMIHHSNYTSKGSSQGQLTRALQVQEKLILFMTCHYTHKQGRDILDLVESQLELIQRWRRSAQVHGTCRSGVTA